jgi:glutamine synthetase type III
MLWGKRAVAKAAVVANAKQATSLQEKKNLIDKVRLFDRLTSLDTAQRRSALREVHRHVYGENPEAVNLDRDILSALSRLRQSPDALERFLADRAWNQALAAK